MFSCDIFDIALNNNKKKCWWPNIYIALYLFGLISRNTHINCPLVKFIKTANWHFRQPSTLASLDIKLQFHLHERRRENKLPNKSPRDTRFAIKMPAIFVFTKSRCRRFIANYFWICILVINFLVSLTLACTFSSLHRAQFVIYWQSTLTLDLTKYIMQSQSLYCAMYAAEWSQNWITRRKFFFFIFLKINLNKFKSTILCSEQWASWMNCVSKLSGGVETDEI